MKTPLSGRTTQHWSLEYFSILLTFVPVQQSIAYCRRRPVYTAVLHDILTSNIDLHTPPASGPMEHGPSSTRWEQGTAFLLTPLCMCMGLSPGSSFRRSIATRRLRWLSHRYPGRSGEPCTPNLALLGINMSCRRSVPSTQTLRVTLYWSCTYA